MAFDYKQLLEDFVLINPQTSERDLGIYTPKKVNTGRMRYHCLAKSAGPTVFKLCEYIPIMAQDLNKGPSLITLLTKKSPRALNVTQKHYSKVAIKCIQLVERIMGSI